MRESSLRWGLGLAAIAAILGVIAEVIGAQFQPHGTQATFDQAIKYLLIAGPLMLIALGIALGLAYFAGMRAERDRPPRPAEAPPDEIPPWGGERRDSALAGAVVMGAYWLITMLYSFVLSLHANVAAFASFAGQHLIQGILFILFGYGLGALGGRTPAARRLLDAIAIPPELLSGAPAVDAPPVVVENDAAVVDAPTTAGGDATV
jgi:hypothetical protein